MIAIYEEVEILENCSENENENENKILESA
jgi:hypothetical protein